MEIDNNFDMDVDSSDEDRPLSPDSTYNSDEDDNCKEVFDKVVSQPKILALKGHTNCCAIYFYYSTGGSYVVCTSCMIAITDTEFGYLYAIRKHATEPHDVINVRSCKNPGIPLYQILPCNMCPICMK